MPSGNAMRPGRRRDRIPATIHGRRRAKSSASRSSCSPLARSRYAAEAARPGRLRARVRWATCWPLPSAWVAAGNRSGAAPVPPGAPARRPRSCGWSSVSPSLLRPCSFNSTALSCAVEATSPSSDFAWSTSPSVPVSCVVVDIERPFCRWKLKRLLPTPTRRQTFSSPASPCRFVRA